MCPIMIGRTSTTTGSLVLPFSDVVASKTVRYVFFSEGATFSVAVRSLPTGTVPMFCQVPPALFWNVRLAPDPA